MIPYGRQEIRDTDIQAVVEVLKSDLLTQGSFVPAFERAVSERVGAEFAVAVNSGTSALHMACKALELRPGGRLWTSPITFVASANCALYCGADVDFVDIDLDTYNMSPELLEEKLVNADRKGLLPDIVVPVHMCGQPCDMKEIHGLSQSYGFKIIEDACHAMGAEYQGAPVGCNGYSDITVFSFHPVKMITTAEGGMALTNDPALKKSMGLFRNHGITRNASEMTGKSHGPWYYQQIDLGYNFRMTDIQAALGLSQLTRLDEYVESRNRLASIYNDELKGLPLKTPLVTGDRSSSYHLYVVRLDSDAGISRAEAYDQLRNDGVGVNVHYIPVHIQPWYERLGFKPGDFPESERYYSQALTLPLFPTMTSAEQMHVVDSLRRILS